MREEQKHNETYFSQRFKAVREAKGISIASLSAKTGLDWKSISRYEIGTSAPRSYEIWKLLAMAHGMTLEEYMDALFGIKKPPDAEAVRELARKVEDMEKVMRHCPLMANGHVAAWKAKQAPG